MRVLVSAYSCAAGRGSEPGNGWNWPLHLAKAGAEVVCIAADQADHEATVAMAMADYRVLPLRFQFLFSPARSRWLPRQVRMNWQEAAWQKRALAEARKIAEAGHVDVAHHVTWGSLHRGSLLWKVGVPLVFGPVGGGQTAPTAFKAYFEDAWREEALRSFLARRLIRLDRRCVQTVRNAAVVVASNAETAQLASSLGAKRVERCLDVTLGEEFLPSLRPVRPRRDRIQLLWLGRLMARKGLNLALHGLSQVHPDVRRTVRLKIVGDGSWGRDRVPRWIRQYGVEDCVEYVGSVPWSEVRRFYAESDIFYFTTLRESGGAQLLEAMAFGLPIVTLNHQGPAAIVPGTAGIKVPVTVPEETVPALARAIERLVLDHALRESMGRVGYQFALTQTWRHRAEYAMRLYKELLA